MSLSQYESGSQQESGIVTTLRIAGCVFAEQEARLLIAEAPTPSDLAAMVRQRAAGVPLEVIVGWAEFCGLRIAVDPEVFVPRKRTEFLARQAIARARPESAAVDLCCGTGALAATIIAELPQVEMHAADIDPRAARCARRNLPSHAMIHVGDLYEPLPDALRGRVGLLVANVPYVPTTAITTMPPEARDHEPTVALDGGRDGLDLLRRTAREATTWLSRDGHLLIETSADQAASASAFFRTSGLDPTTVAHPECASTVVIGRRP